MPAGCDFICKNKSCEYFDHGFTMTEPWPMGRIELILNAPNVKKDKQFRQGLINLKNQGRKYACITYPNVSRIETLAHRVHLWSEDANCIWQFDVETEQTEDDNLTIDQTDIPDSCPKTGGKLLNFHTVTKEGINCPHCGFPMQQDRWFTNEE